MYWGAGCATITNWARAILVIKPEGDQVKVFRFIAAKRGLRIGEGWNGSSEKYFAHSSIPGLLRWEEASAEQKQLILKARPAPRDSKGPSLQEVVGKCLSRLEWKNKEQFILAAKQHCDIGRDRADTFLKAAIQQSLLEVKERPRPRTNPERFYRAAQTPSTTRTYE
jgi:hypothetical protein